MAIEVTYNVEGMDAFKSALSRLDSVMVRRVHEQLRLWAESVSEGSRRRVPVRTGHLRASIFARVGDWVAEVGAEAAYAVCVEFGTRYMRAQPFLFPSVQEALPGLESVLCEAIDAAKMEAGL